MRLCPSNLRPATIWLLLVLLWAAIHPAIINGSSSERVMLCTPQGMKWVEVKTAPETDDGQMDITIACPWCHATHLTPASTPGECALSVMVAAAAVPAVPVPAAPDVPVSKGIQGHLLPPSRAPPVIL